MKDYKAIIFDMDGVLFDTEDFYYKRRETFLADRGISIKHLPPSYFIGGNMKQVWQAILRDDYDKWDVPALQADYVAYKLAHPLPYKEQIFPDVKLLLEKLAEQGYPLALASSSLKKDILRALEETGIRDYFSVVLSGEEFPESKPNPAIYLEALKQLGVTADQALVIEDSEKGIAAGVAAGIEVWAIEDKHYGMNQTAANRLVENLGQIMADLDL